MGFSEQRLTLAHTAIQEFVMTRTPKHNGIYPILNLIILLIQKPACLVVFTKDPDHIRSKITGGSNNSYSRLWVHSMQANEELREAFDNTIISYVSNKKNDDDWIIKLPIPIHDEAGEIIGREWKGLFGICYLETEFDSALKKSTTITMLPKRDMKYAKDLIASIAEYSSELEKNDLHQQHLIKYWMSVSSNHWTNYPVESHDHNDAVDDESFIDILAPVINEIEIIYRELRGGVPGDYSLRTREDAGAPLIWSRYREWERDVEQLKSMEARPQIDMPRPPTIGFYMQVRVPSLSKNSKSGHAYRIIPIVPLSQCRDIAAALIIGIDNMGERAKKYARQYLRDANIESETVENLLVSCDLDSVAFALYDALKIETFLNAKREHSVTYPSFVSGMLTFPEAHLCSRADHILGHGEMHFLGDQGKKDKMFIKPVAISGFPMVAIATKTRAENGREDEVQFDQWYYNYTFHIGIIRALGLPAHAICC